MLSNKGSPSWIHCKENAFPQDPVRLRPISITCEKRKGRALSRHPRKFFENEGATNPFLSPVGCTQHGVHNTNLMVIFPAGKIQALYITPSQIPPSALLLHSRLFSDKQWALPRTENYQGFVETVNDYKSVSICVLKGLIAGTWCNSWSSIEHGLKLSVSHLTPWMVSSPRAPEYDSRLNDIRNVFWGYTCCRWTLTPWHQHTLLIHLLGKWLIVCFKLS